MSRMLPSHVEGRARQCKRVQACGRSGKSFLVSFGRPQCLGRFEAREFRDHHSTPRDRPPDPQGDVVDEDLDLVICEGCTNLVPVNLQLPLTQESSYV